MAVFHRWRGLAAGSVHRRRLVRLLAAGTVAFGLAVAVVGPARARTDILWWHAMSGELGRQLEKLAADFNVFQPDYRVVPVYKGDYTETVMAAVFAFRSNAQPAIVQAAEVSTATMMAAKGAIYPVYELMRDLRAPFDPAAYLPAVAGYYTDLDGNMLSFPFNASTPVLYYSKARFAQAGLDPAVAPKTWPELEAAGRKLRAAGTPCGFTTHWPSWVNVENFSALHDIPIATRANGFGGLDATLTLDNPVLVRHVGKLAEWQQTRLFDYSGRAMSAEPRFHRGECGVFLGSSAARADIRARADFEVGYGMLPYWPDVAGAPRNTIIGGGSLWVLAGRPHAEYAGVAQFFTYLSRPEVQAAWHQATGYLPITRAAFELARAQGFYERNPGTAISIEQVAGKVPTENSKGLRLGSFVLIRAAIEDGLEAAFAGRVPAAEALATAQARGNKLLRQFENASR
jgi:sn-glycerol 3-phosphate transport system substrate-binding protein